MVTAGILPFRENSHGRAGNRTRDLMISSQRLWPLDHEAGQVVSNYILISVYVRVSTWQYVIQTLRGAEPPLQVHVDGIIYIYSHSIHAAQSFFRR